MAVLRERIEGERIVSISPRGADVIILFQDNERAAKFLQVFGNTQARLPGADDNGVRLHISVQYHAPSVRQNPLYLLDFLQK